MRKRNMIVSAISSVIVIGLVVIYMSSQNTTFTEEVSLTEKNVSEIEVIKIFKSTDETIRVTDPNQIKLIMNAFSQTKLRKDNASTTNYTEKYWITLKHNENREFLLNLYNNEYLAIANLNKTKDIYTLFKITNEFDLTVIQGLFK